MRSLYMNRATRDAEFKRLGGTKAGYRGTPFTGRSSQRCTRLRRTGTDVKCPNCHHEWSTAKHKPVSTATIDTAAMSDDQLRAHYRRTSHIGDVRFFIQTALVAGPTDLSMPAITLLDAAKRGLPKAETLRRLCEIQDRWRELETRQGE